jgi:hypothetical protein
MSLSLLVLLIAMAQAQPVPPARDRPINASGTAAVSGQITAKESKAPISRAIVTLVPSAGGPPREAIADADGRYEFTGLAAGEYGLVAGPGELRATYLRQAIGRSEPLDPTSRLPRSGIEIADGERKQNVDVALTRALAIEGRVLSPWGEAMANVMVEVYLADGRYQTLASTDDRGEYRAYGLPPGRYRLCAAADQGDTPDDTARLVRTCHPAATDQRSAADVDLASSDAGAIDISVQRRGTFSVSGSVVTAAGEAAESAHASAIPDGEDSVGGYAQVSGGQFVIRGLMPGRYVIRASTSASTGRLIRKDRESRETEAGHTTVDVAADVSGVFVTMAKPRVVAGQVIFEGGTPMPPGRMNMSVHYSEAGPRGMRPSARQSGQHAVDDTLRFELTPIYDWPVTLGFAGFPDGWVVKAVRFDGRDILNLPTSLVGDTAARLEVVLTDRVASPSIRVTDDQGARVASCRAFLFSTDLRQLQTRAAGYEEASSAEGVVNLGHVVPGEYFFAALDEADARLVSIDRTRLAELASVATRVTLAIGDRRTFDLKVTPLPARTR